VEGIRRVQLFKRVPSRGRITKNKTHSVAKQGTSSDKGKLPGSPRQEGGGANPETVLIIQGLKDGVEGRNFGKRWRRKLFRNDFDAMERSNRDMLGTVKRNEKNQGRA